MYTCQKIMLRATLIEALRAVHLYGLATRRCGKTVRQWIFDQMYLTGKWNFNDNSPELISAIEDYCSKGTILILGCGNASIVRHLKRDTFQYLVGIDISPEAISMARRHADERMHFEVKDICDYHCQRQFDVILFAESLYYIRAAEREAVLKHFSHNLTPHGCIIVTLVNPDGYRDIINMIRTNFEVVRETRFEGTDRCLLGFR